MGFLACPAFFMRPFSDSFINLGAKINKKGLGCIKSTKLLRLINKTGL
jgi:hypothetical protein